MFKFFNKSKKNGGNKENVNTKRHGDRDSTFVENDDEVWPPAKAIPNPYSVWTEPKKTKGPSSCPGVAMEPRASCRAPRLAPIEERRSRDDTWRDNRHDDDNLRWRLEMNNDRLRKERAELRAVLAERNEDVEEYRFKADQASHKLFALQKDLQRTRKQVQLMQKLLQDERDRNEELEQELMQMKENVYEERAKERLASSSESSLEQSPSSSSTANTDDVRVFRGTEEWAEIPRCSEAETIEIPPPPADSIANSSSDDDNERIIQRQLRKKGGGAVKYNPPRQSVKERHYKRYGKHEVTALNDFKFLEGEVTDVSGLLTSPDVSFQ